MGSVDGGIIGGGNNSAPVGLGFTTQTTVAWAVLFLFMIVATDIPAISNLGAGLSVLLLVSVTLKYGPTALGTITSTTGSKPV